MRSVTSGKWAWNIDRGSGLRSGLGLWLRRLVGMIRGRTPVRIMSECLTLVALNLRYVTPRDRSRRSLELMVGLMLGMMLGLMSLGMRVMVRRMIELRSLE